MFKSNFKCLRPVLEVHTSKFFTYRIIGINMGRGEENGTKKIAPFRSKV